MADSYHMNYVHPPSRIYDIIAKLDFFRTPVLQYTYDFCWEQCPAPEEHVAATEFLQSRLVFGKSITRLNNYSRLVRKKTSFGKMANYPKCEVYFIRPSVKKSIFLFLNLNICCVYSKRIFFSEKKTIFLFLNLNIYCVYSKRILTLKAPKNAFENVIC